MTLTTVAQGSQSQLLHKKQTGIGVQATGNFTFLRFNTNSLVGVKGSVESNEISKDREVKEFRGGNLQAQGSTTHELVWGAHEWLMESAMWSSFDSNGQLRVGTTPGFLSLEDGATDIAQYQMFADATVAKMDFSFQPEAMVMMSCDWVGVTPIAPSGSSGGGTPVNFDQSKHPFDTFSAAIFDNIAETGNELAVVTGMDLSIDNKTAIRFVLGQQTGACIENEGAMISGQITALYDSALFLSRFLNETEFSLVNDLVDPSGNHYRFKMPRVKLETGAAPVVDKKSRTLTAKFRALKDPTSGYSLRIDRV